MMPNDSQASRDYCADLVKRRDEDRWLSAQYATPQLRRRLIALAAFQCELRHIPAAVSEPPLGEIRLQWWRDALEELRNGQRPRTHPVVEELLHARIFSAQKFEQLDGAIESTARTLYGSDFADIDDLTAWLGETDGALDEVAYCLATGDDAAPPAVRALGAAFAMAREGARLAPAFAMQMPGAVAAQYQAGQSVLRDTSAAAAPAVLHLALARDYVRGGARPFPLRKRLRLFQAMAFGEFGAF